MPEYFRHKNGGGKIYDSDVSADSFVSRDSKITDESAVVASTINQSKILNSIVSNAQIFNSAVSATTVAGTMKGLAHIWNSQVMCDLIAGNVLVNRSTIWGESKIKDKAQIFDSRIHNLFVCGTAHLSGVQIESGNFGRVSRGVWHRPPRIERWKDLQLTVTESVKGFVFVGCKEKPIEFWFTPGAARFGRANGWTSAQIERLRDLFREWERTQKDLETPES